MRLPCLLIALAAISCSSGSSPSSGSPASTDTGVGAVADTSDEAAVVADAIDDTTPPVEDTAPPCGYKVGNVLCDLDVHGYLRNETTGLATSVALSDFKISDALALGTQKYALVYDAAYW